MECKPSKSNDFLQQKATALVRVAEAFGYAVTPSGNVPRELLLTPQELNEMRAYFEAPNISISESFERVVPPSRSDRLRAKHAIFTPTRSDGSRNPGHLSQHNPEIIHLLDAMYDQYVQCHAWDGRAQILYDLDNTARAEQLWNERVFAIEEVRAQIAPFYLNRLMEQGLAQEEAFKVVGNLIYHCTKTMNYAAPQYDAAVYPQRITIDKPSTTITKLESYAALTPEGDRLRHAALRGRLI